MSSSVRSVLLLWLVLLPLGINGGGRAHVKVRNGLDGNLDLTLHCKSKDDDLGEKLLRYEQTFEFSFRPWTRLLATTLFYCSFRWQGACHWFDIYRKDRDKNICKDCDWTVTQAGPCRNDGPGQLACYEWKKETC